MKIKKAVGQNIFVLIVSVFILTASSGLLFAEIVRTPEGVILTHYPDKFDLSGIIDRIDEEGIVVHDRYFPFAPRVKFLTPRNSFATARSFEAGQEVGLVLNEKRQVSALCLIYRGNQR